jgi:hypothetical protein
MYEHMYTYTCMCVCVCVCVCACALAKCVFWLFVYECMKFICFHQSTFELGDEISLLSQGSHIPFVSIRLYLLENQLYCQAIH